MRLLLVLSYCTGIFKFNIIIHYMSKNIRERMDSASMKKYNKSNKIKQQLYSFN